MRNSSASRSFPDSPFELPAAIFCQSSTNPMAQKLTATARVNQMRGSVSFVHSRVETTIAARMRSPPMVGVPALLKWPSGPSSRIA